MNLKKYYLTALLSAALFFNGRCLEKKYYNPLPRINISLENKCVLDETVLELLRFGITEKFSKEISDIIKKHLNTRSEKGGNIYFYYNSLVFYEAPNLNDDRIVRLENILEYDEGLINEINMDLENRYINSICSPSTKNEGWKFQINVAKNILDKTGPNDVLNLKMALEKYLNMLRTTYSSGKIIEKNPKGRFLGNLHTHNNGSEFSEIDICLSEISREYYFLVSFDAINPEYFDFYAACGGETSFIGKYKVIGN